VSPLQATAIWRHSPPPRRNSRFMVGHDAAGRWIVTDIRGLTGGVFADRAAAIHFAMAECDYDAGEVCAAPEGTVLSLDSIFVEDRRRSG
jgi:hypothetical protein